MRKLLILCVLLMAALSLHPSLAACQNIGSTADATGELLACANSTRSGAVISAEAWVLHCYGPHCDLIEWVRIPATGASMAPPTYAIQWDTFNNLPNVCVSPRCTPSSAAYPTVQASIDPSSITLYYLGQPITTTPFPYGVCISSDGSCSGSGDGLFNYIKVKH